ncbi:MAG: MATE family efflux transporter [Desulfovibrionaceae bacterium]
MNPFKRRWQGPGGYSQVLSIGMPMVIGMISHSVMQFTDRIFLGRYDLEAIAASMPASIMSFMFISFFMGIAEYLSVFVAQYTGAARHERVGAVLWQGLWFCLPAWMFLASLALFSGPLFALGGHPQPLRELEVAYFNVLTLGGGLVVLSTTLAGFFSGRGMTIPVMAVNTIGAAVNIPLDYALINGWGWFPELGIVGAGLATVTGSAVMVLLFVGIIFRRSHEQQFGVFRNWRFERGLFLRYLRFGIPGGFNFFVDMFAVTFFVFAIGRVGELELAATNMVISLDMLAFMPAIGMGIAAGVVVGQSIGAKQPEIGHRATISTLHLNLGYMGFMAALFLLLPETLMEMFRERGLGKEGYAAVRHMGTVMLRFVAVYSLCDAVVLTYFGALKGAGDIRFVMWTIVLGSLACIVAPLALVMLYGEMTYVLAWSFLSLYIAYLALASWLRFRGGKWKRMSVIEERGDEASSIS